MIISSSEKIWNNSRHRSQNNLFEKNQDLQDTPSHTTPFTNKSANEEVHHTATSAQLSKGETGDMDIEETIKEIPCLNFTGENYGVHPQLFSFTATTLHASAVAANKDHPPADKVIEV